MDGFLSYLATRRETRIRAYRATPCGYIERAWYRQDALRLSALIRERTR